MKSQPFQVHFTARLAVPAEMAWGVFDVWTKTSYIRKEEEEEIWVV